MYYIKVQVSTCRVTGTSPIRFSPIGHSPMAKVHCNFVNCRNSTVISSIVEIPGGALAKVQWTFANWQNTRGSIDESTMDFRHWRKCYFAKVLLAKIRNPYMPTYSRFLDSMHYISFRKINFAETTGV
jgi:hypothetical protein